MFYSHEILTSRQYGVATVWLVATLGAKSNTKKVTKKAILEVDVKKACEVILEPGTPMALRLQSNLLYGVSKVHFQQWGYLLHDVQLAQTGMRDLLKVAQNDGIDPDAGKARPDQLVLMDDPEFAIENGLRPPPDWLTMNFDLEPQDDSQRTMLSIRHRSGSVSSHVSSLLSLEFGSSSNGGSYQLPINDPFGGSSAQKAGIFNEDEEELGRMDDLDFGFDANGELRDIPASERQARLSSTGNIPPGGWGRSESGSVIRKDGDALANYPIIQDEDFGMVPFGDRNPSDEPELPILPDAEPFPVMTGGLGVGDRPLHLNDEDLVRDSSESQEASSDEAQAKQKQRKPRQKKTIEVDENISLRSNDLIAWSKEYLQNMATATLAKRNQKIAAQSKKVAYHYLFGAGINGVGKGIGSVKFPSPLDMFAGESLRAKIMGEGSNIFQLTIRPKKGVKRTHSPEEDQNSTPSKRSRESEQGRGNGFGDDMMMDFNGANQDLEHSVEIGREAQDALPDRPSSAMMPWNISASLHSHQRGLSSSAQGKGVGSQLGSVRNRISASPLIGRGSAFPGDMERFSQQIDDGEDGMIMYGRSDDFDLESQGGGDFRALFPASSRGPGSVAVSASQHEEFQIFGAAAQVDTQTAGDSQWVKEALHRESENFLSYVQNSIEEKFGDELGDEGEVGGGGMDKSVAFEELFVPERNTCIVAAQAFYHVLCLATKGRVWVEQDGVEGVVPFGEIRIGVL